MPTMKCPACKRKFPAELINPMCVDGNYFTRCPLCALAERNEAAGLPCDTPFTGTNAHAMFCQAVKHLCKTKQGTHIVERRIAKGPKAPGGFTTIALAEPEGK